MFADLDRSWERPSPTAVQVRHDATLGVLAALVGVVSVELWRSAYDVPVGAGGVEAYALFAAAGLLLAGRRRLPLTVLLLESALFVVIGQRLGSLGATFTIQMVMFASMYAAWAWSRRTRSLIAATAVVVGAMFGWLVWALLRPGQLPTGSFGLVDADVAAFLYSLAINVVYFGGAIAWGQGAYNGARRSSLVADQRHAERRHREREQRRAVHDERLRIARDLHDMVAHHVSGIGVQAAGAGRVLSRDPASTLDMLRVIEGSSRDAVAQMHQLVGLLRGEDDPDSPRGPQPGLCNLPELADPPVTYHEVGTRFPVPETVGASLFRVAQEAVTNVRRHSGARRASLFLRYVENSGAVPDPDRDRAVEVEMIDDGKGAGHSPRTGGYGLRGIAERAAMHDGEVDLGPRPHGGFRVRVRIPVPMTCAGS